MREINIDELKLIQLNILKEVHEFCVKNNLQYFLGFGTLIGAIRHKGFIPWDDDIDICMRREDYDFFTKNFTSESTSLVCYSLDTDPHYDLPYAKVSNINTVMVENSKFPHKIGVNIDIFPVDGVPNNGILRKILLCIFSFIFLLMTLISVNVDSKRSKTKNIVLFISQVLLRPVTMRFLSKLIDILAKSIPSGRKFSSEIVLRFGLKCYYESTFLSEYVEVEFENNRFMTIQEYDKYLRAHYGDYMVLPPVADRVSHHDFKAYWK